MKWVKVIDNKTKEVQLGAGQDAEYYASIGMTEQDVEQCDWNYKWYLEGYLPAKPEPSKEEKIAQLKYQLSTVDEKSARSMRAILAGTATDDDRAFLAQLETQAEDLRRKIKELEAV